MKVRPRKKKNTAAIRKLAELLPAVLDSFGWYGIATDSEPPSDAVEAETGVESDQEQEPDEAEEEEGGEPTYYFDPADVQGAVDEAISNFIEEHLVTEFHNPKKPPSLDDIFGVLFGPENELTKQIEYFEELISGYEDRAHVDDLNEAYRVLRSVIDRISRLLKREHDHSQRD